MEKIRILLGSAFLIGAAALLTFPIGESSINEKIVAIICVLWGAANLRKLAVIQGKVPPFEDTKYYKKIKEEE